MGKAVTLGVTLLKRFVPCSHVTYTLFPLQFHTGHGQGCDVRHSRPALHSRAATELAHIPPEGSAHASRGGQPGGGLLTC